VQRSTTIHARPAYFQGLLVMTVPTDAMSSMERRIHFGWMTKIVLEWRGKKYDLTDAIGDEPGGCAKAGWHAKGNGTTFTFCAATQGYGAIEDKDGVRVRCNLKR
jgi:hypothetical protein